MAQKIRQVSAYSLTCLFLCPFKYKNTLQKEKMMEGYDLDNDAPETRDDSPSDVAVATEEAAESTDTFGALQERMAGSPDDDPWYSASTGAVVDSEGNQILDANGNPFKSMDQFEKYQAQTATPKTNEQVVQQTPPKPMSRSFESMIANNGEITPERLFELSKVNEAYKYENDLIPQVQTQAQAQQQAQQAKDPTEIVRERRDQAERILLDPVGKLRQSLINQGAEEWAVDNLIKPIVEEIKGNLDKDYKQQYEKSLEEKLSGEYGSKFSKIEQEKLTQNSKMNVERLAKQYYPEYGEEAFFALTNGAYDDKGTFQRGPSAEVMDLLAAVAFDGKSFSSNKERDDAYLNMFQRITADPSKARTLFSVAHNFWIGKNAQKASKSVYEKGKQAAAMDSRRIKQTIRTKPASYAQPTTSSDNDGLPQYLRDLGVS